MEDCKKRKADNYRVCSSVGEVAAVVSGGLMEHDEPLTSMTLLERTWNIVQCHYAETGRAEEFEEEAPRVKRQMCENTTTDEQPTLTITEAARIAAIYYRTVDTLSRTIKKVHKHNSDAVAESYGRAVPHSAQNYDRVLELLGKLVDSVGETSKAINQAFEQL